MLHPELYFGPEKYEDRKKCVANRYPYPKWKSKVEHMSEQQIETLFSKFQEEEIMKKAKEIVDEYITNKYKEDKKNEEKL